MRQVLRESQEARRIIAVVAIAAVLSLGAVVYAGVFDRTWKVHASATNDCSTICSDAVAVLHDVDRADDISTDVTINCGSVDAGWTFTGDENNDGQVLSKAEETAFDAAAAAAGKNTFRIVKWQIADGDNQDTAGFQCSYGIVICDSGTKALAHEIGHLVGLEHNTENKTHRIMNAILYTVSKTVNCTEKAAYEN